MGKKLLAEMIVLILPAIIFAVHKIFPGNSITPYFIPKNLTGRKYPKAELRQAGVGYCALALWMFSVIYVTTDSFLHSIERIPFLMALLFFVLPIATAMSLIIGISYLLSGIFGRGDQVKPNLESMDDMQKELLPKYIRKIKIYNAINLACPVLLIVLIPTEVRLNIAEKGQVILLNVSLLITFIMTLWRIRAYLVKAALAMDLSAHKILLSTLSSPLAIFFVWIHSILIIKKFNQQNQAEKKRLKEKQQSF